MGEGGEDGEVGLCGHCRAGAHLGGISGAGQCGGPKVDPAKRPKKILATVDGQPITDKEAEEATGGLLHRARTSLYEAQRMAAEEAVASVLVRAGAGNLDTGISDGTALHYRRERSRHHETTPSKPFASLQGQSSPGRPARRCDCGTACRTARVQRGIPRVVLRAEDLQEPSNAPSTCAVRAMRPSIDRSAAWEGCPATVCRGARSRLAVGSNRTRLTRACRACDADRAEPHHSPSRVCATGRVTA